MFHAESVIRIVKYRLKCFWGGPETNAENQFPHTNTARNVLRFRVPPETPPELLSQWIFSNSIGPPYAALHVWVKLGVSIYRQLGKQPLWEEHLEIPSVRSSMCVRACKKAVAVAV